MAQPPNMIGRINGLSLTLHAAILGTDRISPWKPDFVVSALNDWLHMKMYLQENMFPGAIVDLERLSGSMKGATRE